MMAGARHERARAAARAGDAGSRDAGSLAGRTIVVVLAHPDDEALACGGTLARAVDAGAHVVLVCASRGELGSVSDPALAPGGDLASARARELTASARTLGATEVVQLAHPDGYLRWTDGLDEDISAALERCSPDAVITFDSDGLYWHGDHIGVHERATNVVTALGTGAPALYYVSLPTGAMRAVVDAAHIRGGAPDGSDLWGISPDAFGIGAPTPSFRVDVRPWMDRKLAAIRCHRTQFSSLSPFAQIDEHEAGRWLGWEHFRRAAIGRDQRPVLEGLGEAMGE